MEKADTNLTDIQFKHREYYYNRIFVLLEIVKLSSNRELVFLPIGKGFPVRCINASKLDILRKNFEAFRFFQKNYNIYYSLAHLKSEWGMFSFHPVTRKTQQVEFMQKFGDYFIGYDLGLDFDGNKSFQKDLVYYKGEKCKVMKKYYNDKELYAYDLFFKDNIANVSINDATELSVKEQISRSLSDSKVLYDELMKYNISFSVRFSGNRGFHLNVDDESLPNVTPQEKVVICDKLTKEFSKILNLPTLDTSLCEKRRPWKMPYSLVNSNVCLPLTEFEFDNFRLENMNIIEVMDNIKLKERGLLERNSRLSKEMKNENFKKLLDDYEVKIEDDSKEKKSLI